MTFILRSVDPLRASHCRKVIIRPVPGRRWASAVWIRGQSEREGRLRLFTEQMRHREA